LALGWEAAYYGKPYYGYPLYYPSVVVESPAPLVYREQQPAPASAVNYWYYCAAANGYYPYVRECPSGWQKVSPLPPDQQ